MRIPRTSLLVLSSSPAALLSRDCTITSTNTLSRKMSMAFRYPSSSREKSAGTEISLSSRSNAASFLFASSIYPEASSMRECLTKLLNIPPPSISKSPQFFALCSFSAAFSRLSNAASPARIASRISFLSIISPCLLCARPPFARSAPVILPPARTYRRHIRTAHSHTFR